MKKIIFFTITVLVFFASSTNAQSLTANDTSVTIDGNSQATGNLRIGLETSESCIAVGFRLNLPPEIMSGSISKSADTKYKIDRYDENYLVFSDQNYLLEEITSLLGISIHSSFDASGVYNCRITDIEFATKDFTLVTQPDVLFTVMVNNTNSINAVTFDGEEEIFSVAGIKQNILKKGANVVRRADGTAVKVFK